MPSFVLIKPDAVKQRMMGTLLSWFEYWPILDMNLIIMDPEMCRQHYREHINKDFYPELEAQMCSGPSVSIYSMGLVDDVRATALRIRDYYKHLCSGARNLVHASSSEHEAKRELDYWYPYGPQ